VNRSTLSGIQPVMKSLWFAGGLASSLVVGIVALPVPAVAAEMCQGQAATIVGSPDTSLLGTDGDDVIVTKGSRVILALDGNDRVCVTGKSGLVYAGFGDDVVDTTAAFSGRSFLGPGADTYLGGPGGDWVKAAGDPGTGAAVGDQQVDVIDVGAGPATIYSGAPGKGNADTITVGDGNSTVYWSGHQTGGEVEFGVGRHRMQVFLKGDERPDWRLGNGLVSDAGDQLVRWTGFVGDLSVLAFPDDAALRVLGSAAPELLKARACRATIEGRGGDDVVRFSLAPDDGCQRPERRLLGGAGADTLLGSPRGDVLFGGGGRDVADGRSGNDLCRAEVRRRCERH
jgi:Ca2+-binding RTX toxin-like protein